jgi:protein SCO1/2
MAGTAALALLLPLCASTYGWGQSMYRGEDGYVPGQVKPTGDQRPAILAPIKIDQKIGSNLPLDAVFRDESGKEVKLGDYFGKKPVVFTMVYYTCPMLCSQVLNGMTSSLEVLRFNAGRDFEVVAVSIDPDETPEEAGKKKAEYLHRYQRPGAEQGWHFLTGTKPNIDKVAEAVGFHYAYDPAIKQYAHASGIMVATPQGKLTQYFYGIEFSPKDLQLAVVEASQGKVGNAVDELILYCYHYDPAQGHYGAVVMRVLRLAGGFTVLVLGGFIFAMVRRDTRATTGRTT